MLLGNLTRVLTALHMGSLVMYTLCHLPQTTSILHQLEVQYLYIGTNCPVIPLSLKLTDQAPHL